MRKLIVLLFTVFTFSGYSQVMTKKDHTLYPSIEAYYENVSHKVDDAIKIPATQGGMEFNMKFEFTNPKLQFIGADFGAGFNTYENHFKLHFGLAFRKKLFKDFVEVSAVLPRLSAPLDRDKRTGYNTPWGYSVEFLETPVKIKWTQHFYKNASILRAGIVYRFNN